MTLEPPPILKDLREQLMTKLQAMPEKYLALLHEAWLDAETVRLLDEMNEQAEKEQALNEGIERLRRIISKDAEQELLAGKCEDVQAMVRAYRDRKIAESRQIRLAAAVAE